MDPSSRGPVLQHRFRRRAVRGEVYRGDALAFLKDIVTDSANIVFLDPPFNLGKVYDASRPNQDRRNPDVYRQWMLDILSESSRILAPGGALYLYHLPAWAMSFGAALADRLELRHWIAVSLKNGFARGDRLYPAHYALLYFTNGTPSAFRRPRIKPAHCRHCDELVKDYGGYTSIIKKKGINLSDFWEDVSPMRHSSVKHRPQNELPPLIAKRVMQISGRRNALLVDPFAGSGGVVLAAVEAGLRFKACDIVQANCSLTIRRLAEFKTHSRGGK